MFDELESAPDRLAGAGSGAEEWMAAPIRYLTQIYEDNVMNRLKATELGEAFGHLASGEGAQSNRCATR